MPPRTKKLFISYRSSDAAKVDRLASDLRLLHYDDSTPRYTTWQDKHDLPPASPNWWDAIVDAIIACDMFVFNLSQASLQSEVCRAELDYAHRRNRPIIPIVLEDEFTLNPRSGRYELPADTWALIPDWLGEQQFLFYTGTDFFNQFQSAVTMYESRWPRDITSVPRPLNPDSKSIHGNNHALYDAAFDYAYRLAFADAEKHFETLVRRDDPIYADAAAQWLELIHAYAELVEITGRHSTQFMFGKKWVAYLALFPKDFLDGVFDPKDFAHLGQAATVAPKVDPVVVATPPSKPPTTPSVRSKPRTIDLLPAPFAWIPIPAGKVTLGGNSDANGGYIQKATTFDVSAFQIAKYPLTNAQYKLFVDAGGYTEQRWWTPDGWQTREKEKWTEPRYWRDTKWHGADFPVVGVSWYEAVAYCQWLSELTGEAVRLPTDQEWQWAAQGDDGRDYPWGKTWDGDNCNNSVNPQDSNNTTPVRQYEGKGDSPFGVVDMAGNVWEWCATAYKTGSNALNGTDVRVLRGGSWDNDSMVRFRCDCRSRYYPDFRNLNRGVRLALS